MSLIMQEKYNCIIGQDYPERIVDLATASQRNSAKMNALQQSLLSEDTKPPPHCRPSNEQEIRNFFWLPN